jgi:hypothetical protein
MRPEYGENAYARLESAQGFDAVIDTGVVLDHVARNKDHVDRNFLQPFEKCELELIAFPEMQVGDMQNLDRFLQVSRDTYSGFDPAKAAGLDIYRIYEKGSCRYQEYENNNRQIMRSPA